MYFLLGVCENPHVLRVLYFGTLIADIIFTIIPIGIIVMMIVDFSKAVVAGKEEEQKKAVKLIPKRIMYAVIVFLIPWIVDVLMQILDSAKLKVAMDYTTCLTNAREAEGNFEYYDNLLKAEEEAEEIINGDDKSDDDSSNDNLSLDSIIANNIYQSDSRWGSYPLCTNKSRVGESGDNRTISLAGCGFCSLTMVLRSYENDVTPSSVVNQVCKSGYGKSGHAAPEDFVAIASKYGLKSKVYYTGINPKNDFVKTFEPLLKDGKRLIVNMPDHYISVLGIRKDGYLYVGDSSLSRDYSKNGPYSLGGLYDTITKKGPLLNVTAIWKE